MRHHLCWDPVRVREIINPEAESLSDAVFRAVHSDWTLKVSAPRGDVFQDLWGGRFQSVSPRQFLDDFLQPERPHVQVAVLGRSGSGKSHLIHWLRLNIPETDKRMVLVVPKAGTSLRTIIELIVSRLDPAEQQPFREMLSRAGDSTATRDGQKNRLLNELAQAVQELTPSDPDDELEVELIGAIPHILYDPHMRQAHFTREDTIIADIVDHVFAAPDSYRPAEDRRLFVDTDLPLGGADYAATAKLARDAMSLIYLEGGLQRTVDILNRSLDVAIGRTLSFSGDRLIGLMTALRQHLRRKGRELVLLIEDFARLQGIDRALLQALIEQGSDDLCKLRWAIAVTTGFFEKTVETVYTRMTWFVDMDRSGGGKGAIDEPALASFAARYLNAVRAGLPAIEAWGSAPTDESPPNPCLACDGQQDCRASFGAVNGMSLYPFTSKALWNMTARADPQLGHAFNPRILQNQVLTRVLGDYGPAIGEGLYPPPQLVEQLGGGAQISVLDQQAVRRQAPADADRILAFQELYDGSGKLVNLDEGIREAFGIPAIKDAGEPDETEEVVLQPETQPVDRRVAELHAWAEGKTLSQGLSQELRERIFAAVADAIDWDRLGLARAAYSGATGSKPFRQNSVKILNQSTGGVPSLIELQVPRAGATKDEIQRTALALQGLIQASEDFDWSFKGGGEMLTAFLDCLRDWTADVEGQLARFSPTTTSWNAVAGSLELLAVGAALAGQLRTKAVTLPELLDACLRPWQDCSIGAVDLRRLFEKLSRRRQALVDFVRAHVSATKGGQAGAMIDPRLPEKTLRAFRAGRWSLAQRPPKEGRGDPFMVAELYADVAQALPGAAEKERAARLAWLDEMREAFGPEPKRANIDKEVSAAREAIVTLGIGGTSSTALQTALDEFKARQFDDAVAAAGELRDERDAVANLPAYARAREAAIAAGRELAARYRRFLQDADHNLRLRESEDGARYSALAQSQETIRSALAAIDADLARLEPVNAD